jgi:hypothetical protein
MRPYATTYPREVAGLISIDAQSEWFAAALKRLLTRAQYTSYVVYTPPPPGFEHYPDYERLSLDASGGEMRQAQADTPLRQNSAGRALPLPDGPQSIWVPIRLSDQGNEPGGDRWTRPQDRPRLSESERSPNNRRLACWPRNWRDEQVAWRPAGRDPLSLLPRG